MTTESYVKLMEQKYINVARMSRITKKTRLVNVNNYKNFCRLSKQETVLVIEYLTELLRKLEIYIAELGNGVTSKISDEIFDYLFKVRFTKLTQTEIINELKYLKDSIVKCLEAGNVKV